MSQDVSTAGATAQRSQQRAQQHTHPLHALFHPRSIAMIGASTDPTKIGGRTFRYVKDNWREGALYPVNSRNAEVQGVATVPEVAALPEGVDLAFVMVPAAAVVETLEACAARGVRHAVIFSSGFAEAGGDEGVGAQRRIGEIARSSGMRVIGPNCMGVMNVRERLFGTFTAAFEYGLPQPGRVSLVSQSGAFGSHCFVVARERGLGLGLWLTTGNESDVDVADGLAYLAEDPETDVILAYLEGARDKGRLVHALALARANGKPVIMLKVGRSEVGALAASSHTASLVGADAVYDAVFRQYGVHRADTIDELIDMAYACLPRRFPVGRRVGLATISGGVGVLMADAATAAGLELPPLPDDAQARLKELLPFAAVRNPVDFTAQALNDVSLIEKYLRVMLAEGGCDAVVVFLTTVGLNPVMMEKLADGLAALPRDFPNALLVLAMLSRPEARSTLEAQGYLLFEDPTRAVNAVKMLMDFGRSFAHAGAEKAPPALTAAEVPLPHGPLGEHKAKRVLAAAGLPVVPERLASGPAEARAAADALGYPAVLKVASPDILHKSEVGGVVLGLQDGDAVAAACEALLARVHAAAPQARIEGVLVAPMISGGVETLLGVQRDPVFGPVVAFGLGGVFVEVLQDVALRVAPFNEAEAHAMIREIRGYPVLEGARGRPRADVDALARALARLSAFAAAHADRLQSLDVNPFLVLPEGQGAVAVDALIELREEQERG